MEKIDKLKSFAKLWLKTTNKKKYKIYKEALREYEAFVQVCEAGKDFQALLQSTKHISSVSPSFKHAGNSGDIIYALPTLKALGKEQKSHLYLHLNQVRPYKDEHPLGNVALTEKMFEMLAPLLKAQSYIEKVETFDNQSIDYDFDMVRDSPLMLDRGDISRWYMHVFNVFPDLACPSIEVKADTNYSDYVVLARSQRYNNPWLDYRILSKYPKLLFVGVEKEYTIMRQILPNLVFKPVQDFLELAQIIAGSKLFIGNQSFPFAIAEALKVKRVLEVCYYCPNVGIHGANGYDVYFQPHFETLVQKLYA